jgi:PAS domain S-box-containing protein
VRTLLIEDNEIDFRLVERALGEAFHLSRAPSLAEGLGMASAGHFDLVILDLTLGDSSGYETFARARAALPNTPILVLSGMDDEELALKAVSNGAQDYIPKSRLLDFPLDRSARYAVERHRLEAATRAAELNYRTLFDNLPIAAYTCDPDGLLTHCNRKAIELWGRTPELRNPIDRFTGAFRLLSADGARVRHDESPIAKALRERKSYNGHEVLVERPSGETRCVLAHANPLVDETGALHGGINLLVDITAQRQAEQGLRASERFARSVVDSLKSRIAILDQSGAVLAVNKAWEEFAQEGGMAAVGGGVGLNYLSVCDRSREDDEGAASEAAAGIRAVLRGTMENFYFEYPCHSPTGERWFAMRVTPFAGEGSRRVVVSHEDITARKVAERLAVEQQSMRAAVASMEKVLGIVGHELRTPLAALRAISEFLLTSGARDTAEADRFTREISREVDRMSDTVNNLLEAARLNSGRARWNWSEFDLADVVDEAVESIRPLVDASRLRIDCASERLATRMTGDAEAVRRLLVNFLSNAWKHTTDGRIEVRTVAGSDARGSWVELSVSDTGCGIPPEIVERLGEAFSLNAGVVGPNHVSGTGLGLAICKGIARAHGGTISVKSEVGRGTTVTARLRADLKEAAHGSTSGSTSRSSTGSKAGAAVATAEGAEEAGVAAVATPQLEEAA